MSNNYENLDKININLSNISNATEALGIPIDMNTYVKLTKPNYQLLETSY